MHHFIYPSQDTFITDTVGFEDLNFGIDEILRIGNQNITSKVEYSTTTYPFDSGSLVTSLCVQGFSGSIATGSIYGISSNSLTRISNSSSDPVSFVTDYFSGSLMGDVLGWINGTPYSASNTTESFNNFSGSINVKYFIDGQTSGSLSSSFFGIFNGSLYNFTGKIVSGLIVDGKTTKNVPQVITINKGYKNRALIQFDITEISKSISNGSIANPQFRLKLNVARELEMPIKYEIYAFPISESWVMGDGYVSDGGSEYGASWLYRDNKDGTLWSNTGSSYIQSPSITQSFDYQVGDINMDVTPIVNSWLSGSLANNGIVLISSDEFSSTSTGMGLYFFSKDTNTIYEPILDVGWDDVSWTTGSVTTSSINVQTIDVGLSGIVSDHPTIEGNLSGGFTGIGNISISADSASGLISVTGVNGLIISMSIVGNFSGSISSSIGTVARKCNSCVPSISEIGLGYGQNQSQYEGHDIYGWGGAFNEFNQYNWTSDHLYQTEMVGTFSSSSCGSYEVTNSYLMGVLIDGNFSGSIFTSSLINGYILGYGTLTGSWNESMIVGGTIKATYPFIPAYPGAIIVVFSGSYINGSAFGSITNLSASYGIFNYGIFDGVFTNGTFVGKHIHAPFSGSILSSSYSYTSSINLSSSSLSPVNTKKPFTTVVQNIPSSVKSSNIIRVNVFARQEFPLKNFNRQTQFTQFLTPQYLPSQSFYSIKDNETEQILLDFDENTRLSCDEGGNYFMLDTTGYPQERYFKILIKVKDLDSIYTFDKGNIFKIIR
jgi:hypothetical protein